MINKIILPSSTEEGQPRISYSQITSWNEEKSFNKAMVRGKLTEVPGKVGYILDKFLKYDFPPTAMDAFAPFGEKCENAICNQDFTGFDETETAILKTITPIGVFQHELNIDFGDFSLVGYIDDKNEDSSWLRDYKTCSKSTASRYEKDNYFQLDIYAMDEYFKSGRLPEKMEVVRIGRKGSPFKGEDLKVDCLFPTVYRTTSISRLQKVEEYIRKTVQEISDTYKIYLEIFENKK